MSDVQFEEMVDRLMNGSLEHLTNMIDVEKITTQIHCLFGKKVKVIDVETWWTLEIEE
jgi:hypothetical protein